MGTLHSLKHQFWKTYYYYVPQRQNNQDTNTRIPKNCFNNKFFPKHSKGLSTGTISFVWRIS